MHVTIVLIPGKPHPETLAHMSFHLRDMDELRRALETLKKNGVQVEDPGDEIGPEAQVEGHLMEIGVSIGMALFPQDATARDELIVAADADMYRTKVTVQ